MGLKGAKHSGIYSLSEKHFIWKLYGHYPSVPKAGHWCTKWKGRVKGGIGFGSVQLVVILGETTCISDVIRPWSTLLHHCVTEDRGQTTWGQQQEDFKRKVQSLVIRSRVALWFFSTTSLNCCVVLWSDPCEQCESHSGDDWDGSSGLEWPWKSQDHDVSHPSGPLRRSDSICICLRNTPTFWEMHLNDKRWMRIQISNSICH